MLFEDDEVPETMNRLRSLANSAGRFPPQKFTSWTAEWPPCSAAPWTFLSQQKQRMVILDVATSHTVGAAMIGEEIAGFFEYHTSDITLVRLEQLMVDLCEGKLEHDQILKEGGHGAFSRKVFRV